SIEAPELLEVLKRIEAKDVTDTAHARARSAERASTALPNTNRYYIMVPIGGRNTMAKNTSIVLGDHFESFINSQIASGRYGSASEVIRASLRLLEEREQKIGALRRALVEGEDSGDVGELDIHEIKRKARRRTKPGD
ncbi:MAG TPA: type II toxin-antitoxin system ParD family antitoxin, partial [Steroidobacteraceae bacterium]|nr:type II toxin-antitoxin system ParD family antitoxin [Steroidobacteraceae bacterium]